MAEQLHVACKQGQIDTIRQLLDGGTSLEALYRGKSPLHTAVLAKKREAVEFLLDRGANIEAIYKGMTPLHWAIWGAEMADIVHLLLDRGASAHALGKNQVFPRSVTTTLHLAVDTLALWSPNAPFLVVMSRIIDLGVSVDARDDGSVTPLMWAAEKGRNKMAAMELFMRRGADINATDNSGWSALHFACAFGETDCAEFLVLHGAEMSLKDKEGRTALEIFGAQDRRMIDAAKEEDQTKLKLTTTSILLTARNIYIAKKVAVLERPARTNSSMLFSEQYSDVVFICEGGGSDGGAGRDCDRVHAHRNIVAACSEQLSTMLQGQWAETTGGERVHVAEVKMSQSGNAVRALLRFMYTGVVDEAALDANLHDVLELAALYGQVDLTAACEERGIKGLTIKTVVPLLMEARLHNLYRLKKACIELIKKNVANMASVMLSSSFASLNRAHPLLWKEMRAALGLPAEEEHVEEEERQQEHEAKRARVAAK
jgi:ankyrin repeat protein